MGLWSPPGIRWRGAYIFLTTLAGFALVAALGGSCSGGSTGQEQDEVVASGPFTQSAEGPFGFGREATDDEIRLWDSDIGIDGTGLPDGEGTVDEGGAVYAESCAVCHGGTGRGVQGIGPALVLPFDPDVEFGSVARTIGNFWPYATSLFDYIGRAMPANSPGSLTSNEVYGLVAWLLFSNSIIDADEVMSDETLPKVTMPALKFFQAAPGVPD